MIGSLAQHVAAHNNLIVCVLFREKCLTLSFDRAKESYPKRFGNDIDRKVQRTINDMDYHWEDIL
jgi:hypothetical protein